MNDSTHPNAGKEEQTRARIILHSISRGVNGSHDGGVRQRTPADACGKTKRGVGGI